jgi:hypothetical protein
VKFQHEPLQLLLLLPLLRLFVVISFHALLQARLEAFDCF